MIKFTKSHMIIVWDSGTPHPDMWRYRVYTRNPMVCVASEYNIFGYRKPHSNSESAALRAAFKAVVSSHKGIGRR